MASRRIYRLGCLVLLAALLAGAGCKSDATRLPALGAETGAISVSGFSSGAYMAGQFHIAHSRSVIGAGIVAGGPYGCAESVFADSMPGPGTVFINLSKAVNGCMLDAMQAWGVPNARLLAERARQLAEAGRIDPLEGLARARVYLFTGTNDRTVVPAIVRAAKELYAGLGVPGSHIELVADVPAGHAFITTDAGTACGTTAAPYITDCDYDQAGAILRQILGPLQPRAARAVGESVAFDQREFVRDLADHGLGDTGLIYMPPACRAASGCRVHVVFHGCNQHQGRIGDAFAKDAGFANWADANRLIVLFPQTTASPVNPQACWDWWGYTGREYLTRKGVQMVAVRRMLERLAARPAAM